MKLKDYIKKVLEETNDCIALTINFDIGIDEDVKGNIFVNEKSKNRVNFMVIKDE